MSRLRANEITNRMANGAPTVSNGLVISGVSTHVGLSQFQNTINLTHASAGQNYIYFNEDLQFAKNGTGTRLKIDSKGQLSSSGSTTAFDGTGSLNGLQMYYETDNGQASFGSYSSGGNTELAFYTNAGGGAATEKLRIGSTGQVNFGTSATLKAEINNSVNGHYFVSQCSDNNDGFQIYQQHGNTASRNTLAVYDNRSGSKQSSFVVRGDGVKITTSRGVNYAKTYEFNYNDGAPGGQQTVSLATVINTSGSTSAVAEVTYVGVYGIANDYIYTGKWICGVRRASSNSAWNQTAAEVAANGSNSTSSLDLYWSNGQLYAQTVGPWMGWTVNVRITIINGDITVNV